MSLCRTSFIFTIYFLHFYGFVVCRISNERRCANVDCSEPISFATTILRYNADDKRLLSFARNIKAKVFSKEAGDNPTLWEVEINGKRGYAPRAFLREDKVIKSRNELIVVPTGREDDSNQNATKENMEKVLPRSEDVADYHITPKLPEIHSKGLFNMIGGVSADSVPPNSPDIKPQSTSKFEVFDGTTVYYGSDSDQPKTYPEKATEINENLSNDIVPSRGESEVVEEKRAASHLTESETEHQSEKENEVILKENEDLTGKESVGDTSQDSQTTITSVEVDDISVTKSNLFNNFVNTISTIMSSGAGETDEGIEEEDIGEEEIGEEKHTENNSEQGSGEIDSTYAKDLEKENTIVRDKISFSSLKEDGVIKDTNLTDEKPSLDERNVASKETSAPENAYIQESSNKIKSDKQPQNVDEISNEQQLVLDDEDNTVDSQNENISEASHLLNIPPQNIKPKVTVADSRSNLFLNEDHSNKDIASTEIADDNISSSVSDMNDSSTSVEHVQTLQDNLSHADMNNLPETNIHEVEELSPVESNKNKSVKFNEKLAGAIVSTKSNIENTEIKSVFVKSPSAELTSDEVTKADTMGQVTSSMSAQDFITSTAPTVYKNTDDDEFSIKSDFEQSKESSSTETTDLNHLNISPLMETEQTNPNDFYFGKNTMKKESYTDTEKVTVKIEQQPEITESEEKPFDVIADHSAVLTPDSNPPKISTELPVVLQESFVDSVKEIDESLEMLTTSQFDKSLKAEINHVEEVEEVKDFTVDEESSKYLQERPSLTPEVISTSEQVIETEVTDGMFSWLSSLFGLESNSDQNEMTTEDISIDDKKLPQSEIMDSTQSHVKDEACLADGVGEEACEMLKDISGIKDITWQESLYTSDMTATLDLLDKIPLEATIWLIVTAVVVLIFSLGHYYIEAHRRDGPLVAVINKLEREVLILKKETCILEDKLNTAEHQLEAWNTNSSENDAYIVELKQELEETKVTKIVLEEQIAVLEKELESATESGLEMHRLLESSLSSQDGSQVLLSTVETLREKLEHQEDEITSLSQSLLHKNHEVEELQEKLAQSREVAHSLEERIITITREKEEEALQLKDQHRKLIAQLEEVMETKALDETKVSTEMSKLRLAIEELQKNLAEKDSELESLKEVVQQLRSTDSNDKMEALFDVVGVQAKLKTVVIERDEFREKFHEEEGARKLLEGHMKKITQEVAELKNSYETAEKEKIEALTKLQVLSNYFKEKESQLQKELGLQESMWLQKQSDDHTIYEQMRSLREENEKYKLQNESLKKEIVEQESSFKIQLANVEQKSHENWVASRQAERRLKEVQQEAAQLRNRLTMEKNSANFSLDESKQISESNGDPSSPPPSLIYPATASPPFMMYPMPAPGDFVPPPPLVGSPYPSDSRPPPLGRISSPPLDHRFSPPPPIPYPPYDYPPYGHHSPSPPPPLPPHSHHRNVHKPQPREMSRDQKDHVVSNYSPEGDKSVRRNKR